MNPAAKTWGLVTAILVLGIIVLIYLLFHSNGPDALSKKVYTDSIRTLEKRFDSLQGVVDRNNAEAANLKVTIDSAMIRDSIYRRTIADDKLQIKKIKIFYENPVAIDTFSRADLLRYLSDSVPTQGH